MAKGLIPPDILEMISCQKVIPPQNCSALISPSMYLKQMWDQDNEYKFYYHQIFSYLHDAHITGNLEVEAGMPCDLKDYYNDNNLDYAQFKAS